MKNFILLIALMGLSSCTFSAPVQKQDLQDNFLKDMILIVNGQTYDGVGVLPYAPTYKIHAISHGDLDLFSFSNCHREEIAENAWNVESEKRKFLFKKKIEHRREVKFDYSPTEIEKEYCPLYFAGYDKTGKHSWGFLDIETPEAKLPANLHCSGRVIKTFGVSVCQGRAGSVQKIVFNSPMTFNAPCLTGDVVNNSLEFTIPDQECVVAFKSEAGHIHRMTLIPYQNVKIRGK